MYVSRKRRKKNSGKVLMIVMLVIVLIIICLFAYLTSRKKAEAANSLLAEEKVTAVATSSDMLTADASKWRRFVADKGNYEIRFPRKYFEWMETDTFVPPAYKEKVKAIKLSYAMPKACGVTCPTENMSITIFVVDQLFNKVFMSLQDIYGSKLPIVSVDGHQGVRLDLGGKDQGTTYFIVPDGPQTLFIARSYVNEKYLPGLKAVDGYIDFADQGKIFDKILSTFLFEN